MLEKKGSSYYYYWIYVDVLTINVIDAELELIPTELQDNYQIRKIANSKGKKVSEILLDSNFMHSSIDKQFPGMSNRMGRPDIFHHFLNVTQDSILNKKGELRVNIHTKNDQIIRINPITRVPKSYNRFAGIIEKVLLKGSLESPDGVTLMNVENGSWEKLVDVSGKNILLSPKGKTGELGKELRNDSVSVFIGGFSEGDFLSNVYQKLLPMSIFDEELTIWTVAWEVIASVERKMNLVL